MFATIIDTLSNWLYTYILVVGLIGVGLYFTFKTGFVQFRLLGQAIQVVKEPKDDDKAISSFEALMVSTASRVGVGNIAGISTAICLGGAGSVFWMWLIALLGSASAFIESTLAQIYKVRDTDGSSYGGPAYYIQAVLKKRGIGILFSVTLIVTYMGGFNMVAAFNIADAFRVYSFYDPKVTPLVVGLVLAACTGICIFGGGKRLSKVTSIIVPVMAVSYLLVAFGVIVTHLNLIPAMFVSIFSQAFDVKAIFGGFTGSCVMYGIKRGLYSNEAGVGSAPNAAASAGVSHPAKQGLVQMLSVYIDTIVICTSTAFMLLCSGIVPTEELKGAPFVQAAVSTILGKFGGTFVTFALFCFAFTSILGNFYYAEVNLRYLCKKLPSKSTLSIFRSAAVVIVLLGSMLEFSVAWNTADVLMGLMALINLPIIIILGGPAIKCMNDYIEQKKAGKNPVFKASSINLPDKTDFWN